ncbi:MAG: copper resistance protein NlpE [Tannerellaceae bacterium]|nr:copper resistance protein NlpE [Tannerellaceae bacterium]
MKKILLIIIVIPVLIALSACSHNSRRDVPGEDNKGETAEIHTAENSLDYTGIYKGTIPAAGGESTYTTLRIRKNNTYVLQHRYPDHPDQTFEEKGEYTVQGNILTLTNSRNISHHYQIGKNFLRPLDNNQPGNQPPNSLKEELIKQP